jgi:hypothetical protein
MLEGVIARIENDNFHILVEIGRALTISLTAYNSNGRHDNCRQVNARDKCTQTFAIEILYLFDGVAK